MTSAPEMLVQDVITRLRQMSALSVRKMNGLQENTQYPLPKGLRIPD